MLVRIEIFRTRETRMTFSTLRTETRDGVLTITLNRPDKLNALNAPMVRDFMAAIDKADSDDAVRVIVVTGEGRGFCAGADLSGGADTFSTGDTSTSGSTPARRPPIRSPSRSAAR